MTTTPVSGRTTGAEAGRAEGTDDEVDVRLGSFSHARGRHRRPRPRKALFAAGGLALAVGALSLLRPASDSGGGTAEAGPRLQPTTDTRQEPETGRAPDPTDAAATVSGTPGPTSTAPAPMGGGSTAAAGAVPSASPTSPTSAVRTPSGPYAPRTRQPADEGARPPAATPSSRSRAPQPPGPTATPAPGPGTVPPAAGPTSRPGLCLPVVGLCVDPLPGPGG